MASISLETAWSSGHEGFGGETEKSPARKARSERTSSFRYDFARRRGLVIALSMRARRPDINVEKVRRVSRGPDFGNR